MHLGVSSEYVIQKESNMFVEDLVENPAVWLITQIDTLDFLGWFIGWDDPENKMWLYINSSAPTIQQMKTESYCEKNGGPHLLFKHPTLPPPPKKKKKTSLNAHSRIYQFSSPRWPAPEKN